MDNEKIESVKVTKTWLELNRSLIYGKEANFNETLKMASFIYDRGTLFSTTKF